MSHKKVLRENLVLFDKSKNFWKVFRLLGQKIWLGCQTCHLPIQRNKTVKPFSRDWRDVFVFMKKTVFGVVGGYAIFVSEQTFWVNVFFLQVWVFCFFLSSRGFFLCFWHNFSAWFSKSLSTSPKNILGTFL